MSSGPGGEQFSALPVGEVVLFFSDIEGSTALLHALGSAYETVLDDHDAIMRSAFERHGGVEVKNEGDAFFTAFADHAAAVEAAVEIQRRFDAHTWPEGCKVRVRMGLHAGMPLVRGRDYWGIDVHYAARLASAAHGGQVLVSDLMHRKMRSPDLVSLGQHGLKDFPAPREIFQLVFDGRGPDMFPAPRTLSVHRNNLPTIYAPLFGRESVVEDLVRRLGSHDGLVSLVGPGGMGKTRVAVAAAERLASDFPEGVAFVALASVEDDERVPQAIADAVGSMRSDDVEAALFEHLARSSLLVVLDNVEHLAGAPDWVARLVDAAPTCRFLVTSQAPLAIRAERVVALKPLEELSAVAMFKDRSGTADADDTDLLELCRALECVPLALELAAARVALTGLAGLRSALDRDLERALGAGPRDLPERQRGLRAALTWTTGLLTPAERAVLAGLGAFAEAWTLEQAEALFVAEPEVDVWAALERLMALSLVVRRGDGRLTMPERTRRHAQALLAETGDLSRRRRDHAEVVLDALRPQLIEFMLDHRRGVANVADGLGEILHAFDWARLHDLALAARLVAGSSRMMGSLGVRGVLGDEGSFLDFAEEPVTRALLMARQAIVAFYDDQDIERSLALGQEALMLAAPDGEMTVILLNALAQPWVDASRRQEALAAVDRAVEVAAGLADRRWSDLVEGLRLMTLVDLGDYEEAWPGLLRIHDDESRTDHNSMWASSYLGDCALNLGDHATALRYFRQQLAVIDDRALGSQFAQLQGVAAALAGLGHDAQAVELTSAIRHHSSVAGEPFVIAQYAKFVHEAAGRLGSRAADVEAAGARWSLQDLRRAGRWDDQSAPE